MGGLSCEPGFWGFGRALLRARPSRANQLERRAKWPQSAARMGQLRHKTFRIARTWDGRDVQPEARATVGIVWDTCGNLRLRWDAPRMLGPLPRQSPGSCFGLWEYPVLEVFLVSAQGPYVELEFGPAGHWLAISLTEYRRRSEYLAGVDYRWWPWGDRWRGLAAVTLPASHHWQRGNAFLIQRQGTERRYLAAQAGYGSRPDFHRLDSYLLL